MRVKCRDEEHNTMSGPAVDLRLLNPDFSALATMAPQLRCILINLNILLCCYSWLPVVQDVLVTHL